MNRLPRLLVPIASRQSRGSTTITVLALIVTISMVFGAVLTRSTNTYRQVSHVASWQEALLAAEAGADVAMAELRKTIDDPENAFVGWSATDEDGQPLPYNGRRLVAPKITHGGEGNSELLSNVTIDGPPELLDGSIRQWYRVRSTGTTYLMGSAGVTGDKRDSKLRHHSIHWDRKRNEAVSRPQTTRVVELLLKPMSFENAIVSHEPLLMNNHQIIVDSYDSRYSDKSTNGLYDPSKAQANGDVATNSQLFDAGNATVKGDAYTNAGNILDGARITGEQRDDFYQNLTPIKSPTWQTGTYQMVNTGGSGGPTLVGGSKSNPTRYKMSNNLKLTGDPGITFTPSAPGVESYVELWVPGDLDISGQGSIVVAPNTNVIIFLEGNIRIMGTGSLNQNSQPGRLQILGVTPPPNQVREIYIAGNGIIVAAIYAPFHDVAFGATGSTGTMWGAITGKSIEMGGATVIHYDEALADQGYVIDYKVKNWFEDWR